MEPKKNDQPAPHAGEREKAAGEDRQASPLPYGSDPTPKDADRPASKPQGTLDDQVATMESEGQAQPQADELPPEERPKGIPPLPEPDVEGVGEESGPAAGKDSDKLGPDQRKMANDATGFSGHDNVPHRSVALLDLARCPTSSPCRIAWRLPGKAQPEICVARGHARLQGYPH